MVAIVASGCVVLVALLHVGFFWLEAVAWDTPRGRAIFATTPEFSAASRALAANRGLYNGFLAAGLLWGLWRGDVGVQSFFLLCVAVAGVVGAATVSARIFWIQACPALIGLALLAAS